MYRSGTYPPLHHDSLYDLFMSRATHVRSQLPFPPDVSEYMLGLPKARPRFDWFLFAIAAGALLALVVMVLSSFIF